MQTRNQNTSSLR